MYATGYPAVAAPPEAAPPGGHLTAMVMAGPPPPSHPPLPARSPPLPDHALVALVAVHDATAEVALAALYDRYGATVQQLGRRLLRDDGAAEEVLQETFLRLWSQAGRYELDRARFSTWLLRIAMNLAIDERRRMARRPQLAVGPWSWSPRYDHSPAPPPPDDPEDTAPSVPDQVWCGALRDVLTAGLADLPPAQRRAVELVYVGGLTHAECAVTLGVARSTLKTRLALGLRKLAVHLGAHGLTMADSPR